MTDKEPQAAPKTYSIEWTGIATREVGWDEIEAQTPAEAREKWLRKHGPDRRVRAVSEIEAKH
jgi:hypothetical protein